MKVIGISDQFQPVANFERVDVKSNTVVNPVAGAEGQTIKNEDPRQMPPFQSEPSHLVIDFLQKKKERQKKKEYVNYYKLNKGKRAYKSLKQPTKPQIGTKLDLEV